MKSRRRSSSLAAGFVAAFAGSPLLAQQIIIGSPQTVVPNTNPACPEYQHQTDGTWAVLPTASGTHTMMFWGNHESHRITTNNFYTTQNGVWALTDPDGSGTAPFFVIGAGNRGSWNGAHTIWTYGDHDNGGAWLYNVTRVANGDLYGFYHSEDHDWPGYIGEWPQDQSWIPWASVALAKSTDDGIHWTKLGQRICTAREHPAPWIPPISDWPQNFSPWGGTGGNSTRYDPFNDRWIAMYHTFSYGGLRMAATLDGDPEGKFFKYHDGSFSEEAILTDPSNPPNPLSVNGSLVGGSDSLLDGLREVSGATQPSLHYNLYLNKWVVMFRSGTDFYFSTTEDVCDPHWSSPVLFMSHPSNQVMYPSVIGDTPQYGISSHFAGQTATLCFAKWPDLNPDPVRQGIRVPITFNMNPDANFSASVTTTPVKRPVQFTDLSTNQPTFWQWDFDGNGTVESTVQHPTHEYLTPGVYTVKLTAGNSYLPGGNLETKTSYITVGVPEADFHAKVRSGTEDLVVAFMDRSTASPPRQRRTGKASDSG